MIQLSRREEQVLLAIWNLQEEAYLLSILKYLSDITGSDWSLGTVQGPIIQLERKGFINTHMGDSSPIRGGRRKKICRISKHGIEALQILKHEQDLLWENFLNTGMGKVR